MWPDGEHASSAEWKVTSELADDGVTHRKTHLTATDKAGHVRHELEADVFRVEPGPAGHRAATTIVNEGLARWTYQGRTGYGISEYLHQLDAEARPVVPIGGTRDSSVGTCMKGSTMRDVKDRVAVVTGAASGIGWPLAHRFAAEGMHSCARRHRGPTRLLEAAARRSMATGVEVLAVPTDVVARRLRRPSGRRAYWTLRHGPRRLQQRRRSRHSGDPAARSWEAPLADWDWTIGVNLMGRRPRRPGVRAPHARWAATRATS